jgi:hypothetical protein
MEETGLNFRMKEAEQKNPIREAIIMKRIFISWFAISFLFGCAPSMVTVTENVGRSSIDLNKLSSAKIALLPFRSTLGYPIRNNTVMEHLSRQLNRNFPQINLIQPGQLGKMMSVSGREVFSRYRTLLDKYFARGRLSQKDLAGLGLDGIDYIIAISLNGGYQKQIYPKPYMFLMSMQIWDVNTGRIVWDLTQEGQVLIELEEENKTGRTALMRHLCDSVLAKLS